MANRTDYIMLVLACADACKALYQGMNGKLEDLDQSVRGGIEQLTTWVKPDTLSLESSPAMLSITGLWRKFGQKSPRTSPGLPTR